MRLHIFSSLVIALVLFTSCHSREVAYVSDAQRDTAQAIMTTHANLIMPGDQLYIYVSSQTPESVIPFNQETHKFVQKGNVLQYSDASEVSVREQDRMIQETQYLTADINGYTVAADGTLVFPVLGSIYVAGITHDSLCNYIENKLKDGNYVNDPMVTTRLMNFRVAVVGEVRSPQQIHVDGTRLTILEALAICGDMTMYGRRDNVTVVRNENGRQTMVELDLTKHDFLESPYYYLQQNDIVYVEPIDIKRRRVDRDPNVPRYISIGVSTWSLIRRTITTAQRLQRMRNQ